MRRFLLLCIVFGKGIMVNCQDRSSPIDIIEQCLYWDSRKLDSLKVYFQQLDSNSLDVPLTSYQHYFSGRLAISDTLKRQFFISARKLAERSGDKYLEGLAMFRIGRLYSKAELYDSAWEYYFKASQNFDVRNVKSFVNPERRKCGLLLSQAYISIQRNDYENAINYSLQSLKLAESSGYDDLKLISLLNLSASYGEYSSQDVEAVDHLKELSKNYMFEAALLAERLGDKRRANRTWGNIGIHYETERQYDSARIFLKQAITTGLQIDDSFGLTNHFNTMTLIFLEEQNLDSASFYSDLAMKYARKSGLSRMEADIMLTSAQLYLKLKNQKEASSLIASSIAISKEVNSPRLVARGYRMLYKIAEKNRDPIASLDYYKKYITYRDSVVSIENLNAIEELKTRYETEKKEQQIQNLEQEQQISGLKIRQQNVLIIGSGFMVLVMIIAGLTFFKNRTLKLSKQRLKVEHQLLRSQMNPHFLFNALSSIHSYIFKGDKLEASEYLTDFSQLTRDILNQSSKEWISLEEELKTLSNYITVQKMRFPEVETTIHLDDLLEDSNVQFPPVLLQPFVENAFEHGLKEKESGKIELEIKLQDEQLKISVKDNGSGLESTVSSQSKAVSIARERLQLLYGSRNFQLSLQNRSDSDGVLVSIVLPKRDII